MKQTRIRNIILLIITAVVLLISVQFYWIYSALKIESEKFENFAREAVIAAVDKIEKKETAGLVYKNTVPHPPAPPHFKFQFPPNRDSNIFNWFTDLKEFEEKEELNVEINSNSDTDIDSMKQIIKIERTIPRLRHKREKLIEKVMTELEFFDQRFDVLDRIDSAEIENEVSESLKERGITTQFKFGVRSRNEKKFKIKSENVNDIELTKSSVQVRLFPGDVFGTPNYLLVYFPDKISEVLRNTIGVLTLSFFVILLVSYTFYKSLRLLLNQKKYSEIKQDLINNVTHELKTPIATISLAADTLDEPSISDNIPVRKKYIGIIKEENDRLKNIVDKILNAAMMEKENFHLKQEPVELKRILSEVIRRFEVPVKEKNGSLNYENFEKNIILKADIFHLENAFANIIDNSIKYCTQSPEIHIRVIEESEFCIVEFQDNGIGISKENYERVFDTFFREQSGNIHSVKGYGIGLNYVKEVVKNHGGEVWLESRKGKGTKVFVKLRKFDDER